MSTAIPRDDDDQKQQDIVASGVAARVYELAEEIAPYISQLALVDLLLDSREKMVNLTTGAEVDIKKIESDAPDHLKDWVHLLTFVAKSGSTDTLTAVNKIIKGIEYLKKQVEGTFGYATYDLAIEKLKEIAANELRNLEKKRSPTNTSSGGNTTIINNVNAVNSSVDLTTVSSVNYGSRKLTGSEIGELRSIILAAFPSEEDFAQTLLFRLDWNWDSIKSGGNFGVRVFNLITGKTEPEGSTGKLIHALSVYRPRNEALKVWADYYITAGGGSGNNIISGGTFEGNTFIGTQRTYRS
jgi:hypothetical protein